MLKIVLICFLMFVSFIESVPEIKRELQTTINPGCSDCDQSQNISNLVYTKAIGNEDTIHYLWSTIGAPTSLIVQTSNTAHLDINWENLLNRSSGIAKAIQFSETPYYSLAVIISKLIEFEDKDDYATLDQNVTIKTIDTELLQWEAVRQDINESSHCRAMFSTTNTSESQIYQEDGKIMLQMDVHGNDDHDDILPRLSYNSNSTQIKVFLNKMMPMLNYSRYGLEIIAIATENSEGNFSSSSFDTINDEYTPGVFKSVRVTSPESKAGYGSFLSWKPVGYTSKDFTVIQSSDVKFYELNNGTEKDLPYSIAKAFFTPDFKIVFNKFNITFGTKEDGYYKKENYLAWSFVSGIGEPISEKFSLLVIMVITSGLGLPFILMISSTVYILFHKYRKNKLATGTSAPLNVD